MQYDIQDRRSVYKILEKEGIELPRHAIFDRSDPEGIIQIYIILLYIGYKFRTVLGNDTLFIALISENHLEEYDDHVEVNGVTFNKPFVEKPISAEDHNIYMYYPTSAGTYHKISITKDVI